ncbi:MAG: DNA-3-methyladenine glycosylase [Actinomycetales bacterium]
MATSLDGGDWLVQVMPARAARSLLRGDPPRVAPALLGAVITSRVGGAKVTVRVTEVEAYGGVGVDPGSHAFRRQTARNAPMFGPPGNAYVYFTYGMHWCLNVVVGDRGTAGAILIRAGCVLVGQQVAWHRRPTARSAHDLARGPARLTAALAVDGAHNGVDLLAPASPVTIALPATGVHQFASSPRTGVSGPGAWTMWRFHTDDPSVSPYRPARARARG